MEAIEYGLLIMAFVSWKDRKKQWKIIYPTNTCFRLLTARSQLLRERIFYRRTEPFLQFALWLLHF